MVDQQINSNSKKNNGQRGETDSVQLDLFGYNLNIFEMQEALSNHEVERNTLEKQILDELKNSEITLKPNSNDPKDDPDSLTGFFRNLLRRNHSLEEANHNLNNENNSLAKKIIVVDKRRDKELERGIIEIAYTFLPVLDAYETILAMAKQDVNDKRAKMDSLIHNMTADFKIIKERLDNAKISIDDLNLKRVYDQILDIKKDYLENPESLWIISFEPNYGRLKKSLSEIGILEMGNLVGKLSDPEYHDGISAKQSDDFPEGTITRVIRKGYMYNKSILRHAEVEIAFQNLIKIKD